ncbi:hypothetical protein XELAEV_18022001mg [Xenopus laevis]|uniref:Uncharacterized protein n=1 Tax=Xenopus laevis TaxID=8355 RepID=A0A974D3X3_XENLA|nr:hypothetical protein XELAEV_18022001mg [Xenopus laevis]
MGLERPQIVYRRSYNLGDKLSLSMLPEKRSKISWLSVKGTYPCGANICKCCKFIKKSETFQSTVTQKIYKCKSYANCRTTNVTTRRLKDRALEHLATKGEGQKVTSHGDVRLLPLCGGCGAETQYCNLNVNQRCPRCQRQFSIGPLFAKISDPQEWQQLDRRLQRWESRYPSTVAEGTQTPTASVADQSLIAVDTPPIAGPTEPVTDEVAVSVPPSGRVEMGENTTPRPLVHAAVSTPLSTRLSSDESPWEEERENKGVGAVKAPLSPVPEGSIANNGQSGVTAIAAAATPVAAVTPSLHYLLINDVTNFWVLPGEAPVREYMVLSRVQKKINLEVSKRWGYYMPYAPEQVYLDVSLLLEDWIHEDILDHLKMDRDSLIQHDRDARRRAKDLVQEKLPMWWLGRTILRTYVCSICKRAPERHYSKDVSNAKGGYSEKPHPAYYVSFEDTKAWFHKMI